MQRELGIEGQGGQEDRENRKSRETQGDLRSPGSLCIEGSEGFEEFERFEGFESLKDEKGREGGTNLWHIHACVYHVLLSSMHAYQNKCHKQKRRGREGGGKEAGERDKPKLYSRLALS